MRKKSYRFLTVIACLLALLLASSPAFAGWDPNPTGPRNGIPYQCSWKFIGGPHKDLSGTSVLTYNGLSCQRLSDGNTLCRGFFRTVFPGGGVIEGRVTIAKPVSCGRPRCSTWEYSVNSGHSSAQCKKFTVWVENEGSKIDGTFEKSFILQFRECSTLVEQDCEFVID